MNIIVLFLLTSIAASSTSYESINNNVTKELTELRAENQKVFLLKDGDYEFRYYASPIHYWNGNEFLDFDDAVLENNNISEKQNSKLNYTIIESECVRNLNSSSKFNSNKVISIENNNISQEKNYLDGYVPSYNTYYNEYYLSDDEYYIFPNNISSESENFLMTASIDSSSNDTSLTYVTERLVEQQTNNPVFQDKYITLGTSGSTNSTSLLAGTDPLQFVDENNNLINYEYVTIFGIDLPTIDSRYLDSAELYLCKNTTTTNINRNPIIYLNKVTSNNTFDSIDGTTSYTTSNISTGLASAHSYTFDITNAVSNSLDNNTDLILTLEGTSSGYASFYSSESTASSVPYVSIVVNSDYLGSTPYGDAPAYSEVTDDEVNCLGYALLLNYGVDLYLESYGLTIDYATAYNAIVTTITNKGYGIREIDSYDSAIYSDERRIAFRHDPKDTSVWHFVMQNSDGSWSGKAGLSHFSGCYSPTLTPNDDDMWDMYQGLIGKNTYYYAIE